MTDAAAWFAAVDACDVERVLGLAPWHAGIRDEAGETALMLAVRTSRIGVIPILLKHEAGLRSASGKTALQLAVEQDDVVSATMLGEAEWSLLTSGEETVLELAVARAAFCTLPYLAGLYQRHDQRVLPKAVLLACKLQKLDLLATLICTSPPIQQAVLRCLADASINDDIRLRLLLSLRRTIQITDIQPDSSAFSNGPAPTGTTTDPWVSSLLSELEACRLTIWQLISEATQSRDTYERRLAALKEERDSLQQQLQRRRAESTPKAIVQQRPPRNQKARGRPLSPRKTAVTRPYQEIPSPPRTPTPLAAPEAPLGELERQLAGLLTDVTDLRYAVHALE